VTPRGTNARFTSRGFATGVCSLQFGLSRDRLMVARVKAVRNANVSRYLARASVSSTIEARMIVFINYRVFFEFESQLYSPDLTETGKVSPAMFDKIFGALDLRFAIKLRASNVTSSHALTGLVKQKRITTAVKVGQNAYRSVRGLSSEHRPQGNVEIFLRKRRK